MSPGFTLNSSGEHNEGNKKVLPKFIIGAVALIAVIAVVAVSAIFMMPGKKNTESFYVALEKTIETVESEFKEASKDIGLNSFLNTVEKNGMSHELSMGMPDNSLGLNITAQSNAKADRIFASVDVSLFGTAQNILQASLDNHFLAFASPILLSDTYGINLDQIESELPSSALGQIMHNFRELAAAQGSSLEFSKKPQTALEKNLDTLKDKIKISDNGTSSVPINGADKNCNKYSLSIPKDALKNYISTTIETIAEDEHFKAFFLDSSGNSSAMHSEAGLDLATQDTLDSFLTSLDEAFTSIKDITLVGYVSEGYLLRCDLTVNTEYAPVFWSIELGTERKLTDALTLTVEADGETYILSHKGSIVPNNAVVESVVSVAMTYAGDSQPIPVMEGSFRWDTNSTNQNLAIHLENPLEEESFDLTGTLTLKAALTLDLSLPLSSEGTEETMLFTDSIQRIPDDRSEKNLRGAKGPSFLK